MKQDEFIQATNRLEQYYDKEYTNEQRRIMFKELEGFRIERYRQLISVVIRKSNFLPKVADFVKADKEEPFIRKGKELEKVVCKKCNNTGYVLYDKKIQDGNRELKNQYASVCSCGNAKVYEGWKVSDKRYTSEFYTMLAVKLGI